MAEVPRTIELTDPRALRAIAHPVRMRLVGLRRRGGPRTATRAAAPLGDSILYLTVDELARLGRDIEALLEPYAERVPRPEARPVGARPVTFLQVAFPTDRVAPDA